MKVFLLYLKNNDNYKCPKIIGVFSTQKKLLKYVKETGKLLDQEYYCIVTKEDVDEPDPSMNVLYYIDCGGNKRVDAPL